MKYVTFDADGVLAERLIGGLHSIPEHAVAVDDDLWFRVINEVDGIWMLEDGEPTKRPLPEEQPDHQRNERIWRDAELHACEWLVTRHRDELDLQRETTLSNVRYIELLTYRQSLRDWPGAELFPDQAERPTSPDWLASLQP